MASIERMDLVSISGHKADLDAVLNIITECGCFHIESAAAVGSSADAGALREENPYSPMLKTLEEISSVSGLKYQAVPCDDIRDMPAGKMKGRINTIKNRMLRLRADCQTAEDKLKEYSQALTQVEHLQGLKVDFQRLFSCSNFKIRFGKLPFDSYTKLSYYEDKNFLFVPLSEDSEYCWGICFSPNSDAEETDRLFDSLYYERIRVPDYVQGNAEDAVKDLKSKMASCAERRDSAKQALEDYTKKEKNSLCGYFTRLKELHDSFDLRSKAVVSGKKFYIVGFVPEMFAQQFRDLMKNKVADVSVDMKPSDEHDRIRPPILMRNGRFSAPFGMFTEMYGLPAYNGINPTTLVAVTYTILFGIMFGDLGQGLCVSIIGWILWKFKKVRLGAVMMRLGISGAIFGTLFGSVFGNEELLDPVYESLGINFLPFRAMHSINTVLYGAIGIGVFIIVLTMLINIFVKFREKNYEEAYFSNNGVAGLVFFMALIGGLVTSVMGLNIMNTPYVLCLIVLPLILMFLREPLGCMIKKKKFHMENGVGDFIASNLFECVEFLLGYATNTLSFVRVGGFVLSHAGMMAVVYSLAEMYKGASPVIIVIGNIFVMGLEGMLVGIQVLRLEFYEIFSRFYDGDGRPFTPVRINLEETTE